MSRNLPISNRISVDVQQLFEDLIVVKCNVNNKEFQGILLNTSKSFFGINESRLKSGAENWTVTDGEKANISFSCSAERYSYKIDGSGPTILTRHPVKRHKSPPLSGKHVICNKCQSVVTIPADPSTESGRRPSTSETDPNLSELASCSPPNRRKSAMHPRRLSNFDTRDNFDSSVFKDLPPPQPPRPTADPLTALSKLVKKKKKKERAKERPESTSRSSHFTQSDELRHKLKKRKLESNIERIPVKKSKLFESEAKALQAQAIHAVIPGKPGRSSWRQEEEKPVDWKLAEDKAKSSKRIDEETGSLFVEEKSKISKRPDQGKKMSKSSGEKAKGSKRTEEEKRTSKSSKLPDDEKKAAKSEKKTMKSKRLEEDAKAYKFTEDKEKLRQISEDTEKAVPSSENKDKSPQAFDDTEIAAQPSEDITRLCDPSDSREKASQPIDGKQKSSKHSEGKQKLSQSSEDKQKSSRPSEGKQKPSQSSEDKQKPSQSSDGKQKPSQLSENKKKLSQLSEDKQKPSQPSESKKKPSQLSEDKQKLSQPSEGKKNPSQLSEDKQKLSQPSEGKKKPSQLSESEQKVSQTSEDEQKLSQPPEDTSQATEDSSLSSCAAQEASTSQVASSSSRDLDKGLKKLKRRLDSHKKVKRRQRALQKELAELGEPVQINGERPRRSKAPRLQEDDENEEEEEEEEAAAAAAAEAEVEASPVDNPPADSSLSLKIKINRTPSADNGGYECRILADDGQGAVSSSCDPPVKEEEKVLPRCTLPNGSCFAVNDIVWAKITGYPWWPARITAIRHTKAPGYTAEVLWFNWDQISFIPCDKLFAFLEHYTAKCDKKRKGAYRSAVEQAWMAAQAAQSIAEDEDEEEEVRFDSYGQCLSRPSSSGLVASPVSSSSAPPPDQHEGAVTSSFAAQQESSDEEAESGLVIDTEMARVP